MVQVFHNAQVLPYRVTHIPRLPAVPVDLDQYAGHIPVTADGRGRIFFWLMANTTLVPDFTQTSNPDRKLIVWFNGGPGCTSLDGVFLENGPYQFTADDQLGFREWSLTRQAAMLYVDQPLGTGFSDAPVDQYNRNYADVTATFLTFMAKFYSLFPELRTADLYLAGESQAGVYIPYVAREMLRRTDLSVDDHPYPLKGLVIGSGWLDPLVQYPAVRDFVRAKNLVPASAISKIDRALVSCLQSYARDPPRITVPACEDYVNLVTESSSPGPGQCYNIYDYRLVDTYPACGMNWPPKIHAFNAYFQEPAVWEALHVNTRAPGAPSSLSSDETLAWPKWTECNSQVGIRLDGSREPPTIGFLPELLTRVPLIVFNGDSDLLCNYLGVEVALARLNWGGQVGFGDREGAVRTWRVNGTPVGLHRSARNLTYVRLFNASHMAGVDRPMELYDLFARFARADSQTLPFQSDIQDLFVLGSLGITLVILLLFAYALYIKARRKRVNLATSDEYHQLADRDPTPTPAGDSDTEFGSGDGSSRGKLPRTHINTVYNDALSHATIRTAHNPVGGDIYALSELDCSIGRTALVLKEV
ncbi:Cell death protease [Tieghemiomyces parasiticus]|uniref:Pheromone-processing carboxypeptidase KEX1 n=1 Tax=Tieghemiomyces parasiticus TaxID=78921 RepID=A0A9W8ABE4_9FUNG|nr:Cell death protease [Tieghemiomyces parasiticus]